MTKHIFSATAVQQHDQAHIRAAAVQQHNQSHIQCYSYTATWPITYSVLQLYSNITNHIFSAATIQQHNQGHIQYYSCAAT